MNRKFDLQQLLKDVFAVEGGERFVIVTDAPYSMADDTEAWQDRRDWAVEWRLDLETLGFPVLPMAQYRATGAHNAEIPEAVDQLGVERELTTVLGEADIALVMTEYSATAPLLRHLRAIPHLRVASMPGVERRMAETALAADYRQIRENANILKRLLQGSEGARVRFESGHEVYFDLRFRQAMADDGYCPPGHPGVRLVNLPFGEAFQAPYEGENDDFMSATIGVIPMIKGDDRLQMFVEENRITDIQGNGPLVDRFHRLFDEDPALRNIAEVGFGCNDSAVVTGNVLEDEKAGFHWAFGRSDHIGGVFGPDRFVSEKTVMHEDVVYAADSPIPTQRIELTLESGDTYRLMDERRYLYPSTQTMDELGLP